MEKILGKKIRLRWTDQGVLWGRRMGWVIILSAFPTYQGSLTHRAEALVFEEAGEDGWEEVLSEMGRDALSQLVLSSTGEYKIISLGNMGFVPGSNELEERIGSITDLPSEEE